MPGRATWEFLFLLLYRHRSKHLGVLVIGVLLVGLLSAVLMLTASLRRDAAVTLDDQADLIVQKVRGGKAVDIPVAWAGRFATIPGVTGAVPRVHGRYFHEPNGAYFTVVGIDPFDTQASGALQQLVDGLDVREFLSGENMIIGPAVARFLDENRYRDDYTFKTPAAESVPVHVQAVLPQAAATVAADVVIMEIDLARRILGTPAHLATDIGLLVPNELERDQVMGKAIGLHYDIRVIQKRELAVALRNLFNYQGGVFLLLFAVLLLTYLLVLYQRYSLITGPDRREIGILRAVGWSIGDVIGLKLAENLTVAVAAYLLGVVLAYHFVFSLGAPLLAEVFLGGGNLPVRLQLAPALDPALLAVLFLLFVVPFAAAVLVPVWRVAVTDPVEAMK